ncbi:hypothetical protein FEM33_21485 [Dyadobacter flavalbus]|uniref:Galactose oxidase n=1 Tax=Dyadobacter flavalbus TaxID=2579942 RepID=A0A5M8QNY0_9BACT|nr:hypothetical protein [Dyadobacter flavalbus]KAA6436714.1 hypothetical protein FEM33_21485 [Dyadobacter flavalbus]
MFFILFSCEKKTFPPTGITEDIIVPVSIVSIEQNAAGTAEITVKTSNVADNNFELKLLTDSGAEIPIQAGSNEVVSVFKLTMYTSGKLQGGKTYTLQLNYKNDQGKDIAIRRGFTAKLTGSWKKLPHAPIADGDFTGAALLSPLYNSELAVYRYADAVKWDILKFDGMWRSVESKKPVPRHNAIAFPLGQAGGRELIFMGFGFINDDKLPSKKAYLNDFWWTVNYYYIGEHAGVVFPLYTDIDRDVKFFLTYDHAFMLKEDFTGAMRSMDVKWDQKECQPLPEKTGKLAAVTINGTGYVINQTAGKAPHLYAYSPEQDKWTRMADFPGVARELGTAFSAAGKGYFGLGIDAHGNGLRDIWQYDPAKNAWSYHSEYPGQGNRLLVSFSDKNKAYLGWGYESRQIEGSAARQQIGCTDFWEFDPQ